MKTFKIKSNYDGLELDGIIKETRQDLLELFKYRMVWQKIKKDIRIL